MLYKLCNGWRKEGTEADENEKVFVAKVNTQLYVLLARNLTHKKTLLG